jgi:hypothetical protein
MILVVLHRPYITIISYPITLANMRTQSVFLLALVTFATTILTAPITFSENMKATIVAVGQDFDQLTAREVGGLVALAAGAESSHQGADASSLLGELPAGHTESRRANDPVSLLALLPAEHEKREDTIASLLAALPAGHDKRANDAATLLGLLPAGHEKRDDTAASLLAALPAGHDKRQNAASSLLAALPAGHGSE